MYTIIDSYDWIESKNILQCVFMKYYCVFISDLRFTENVQILLKFVLTWLKMAAFKTADNFEISLKVKFTRLNHIIMFMDYFVDLNLLYC